jgi:CubicO group peptidase (beta-lactamase class C family)
MAKVEGKCDPRFAAVGEAFKRNFDKGAEAGASIGVYYQGKPVVEMWGGLADPESNRTWGRETITPLASTGKTLATTCILRLIDRGLIDLDAPVATYWPAFADGGKSKITVEQILSHTSGVAALDRAISNVDAQQLDPVLRLIEAQKPFWTPGTRHGYHAITFGFLLAGLLKAVTGKRLGEFFGEEIAGPLKLDLHIGLKKSEHGRVAHMIGPTHMQALRSMLNPMWFGYFLAVMSKKTVAYKATFGGTTVGFNAPKEELRRYEVEDASAGTVGNGQSLARMYAALIGEVDGIRLVSPSLIERVRKEQARGLDETLRMQSAWATGFALPGGPLWPDFGVPGVFGHTGASGSLAFADPERELAFGYAPNKWSELGSWAGAPKFRFEALTQATYKALGVKTKGT